MDTFEADYWTELFEEVLQEGRDYLKRVLKELAPKGYLPLTEPGPRRAGEEMTPEEFMNLPAEKQRYHLRRMVERGGTEQV